jgi:hypothetical protein
MKDEDDFWKLVAPTKSHFDRGPDVSSASTRPGPPLYSKKRKEEEKSHFDRGPDVSSA